MGFERKANKNSDDEDIKRKEKKKRYWLLMPIPKL